MFTWSSLKSFPAGPLDDLLVYDPIEGTWEDLSYSVSGSPPPPRFFHGFTSTGAKLYVHAGSQVFLSAVETFLTGTGTVKCDMN